MTTTVFLWATCRNRDVLKQLMKMTRQNMKYPKLSKVYVKVKLTIRHTHSFDQPVLGLSSWRVSCKKWLKHPMVLMLCLDGKLSTPQLVLLRKNKHILFVFTFFNTF